MIISTIMQFLPLWEPCLNRPSLSFSSISIITYILGRYIPKDQVYNYIEGYCLAIDVTARDMQNEAKKNGLPWTMAKGLDTFCPVRYIQLFHR